MRAGLDQLVLFEPLERLAQRGTADLQLAHQLALRRQLGAGGQAAVQDGGCQLAGGGFCKGSVGDRLNFHVLLSFLWYGGQTRCAIV